MNESAQQGRLGVSFPWLRAQPRSKTRIGAAVIWLAFIVFPLIDAVEHREPAVHHVLAIAGAAVFVAVYVWLVLLSFDNRYPRARLVFVAVLLVDATALSLADRPGWAYLFTYCAASSVLVGPPSMTFPAVLGCAGLSVGCSLIGGSAATALSAGATALGVGLVMVLMRDLRQRNAELMSARAELTRTAVARERERFARDLHDLLGHTLSVIALKAELAGKLLPERADEAKREVTEVEQVAREALNEVRQAVSGYRQPTLDGELAGARMALAAARIEADVRRAEVLLDPEVEAILAWAVREGATNVIRHSGARRCRVMITASLGHTGVEVIDDGAGPSSSNGHGGNGLAGLRERAKVLQGRIEAGKVPGGGFRLAVSVPVTGRPSPDAWSPRRVEDSLE